MNEVKQPASESWLKLIGYWIFTLLFVFPLGGGGVADLLQIQSVVEGMTELGYPQYVCTILGVWKVLGMLALLCPKTPLLKEWAYAGAVFDFTGASASHWSVGHEPAKVIIPLVFTVFVCISWGLRPASRRLR